MMSRIRSKDTNPEVAVRSMVHRMGYRFRLHRRDLPGTPDVILPRWRVAIFVHGCFWHGHYCKKTKMPRSRVAYWRAKITSNRRRDEKARRRLGRLGWKVVVVWECALRHPEALERKLRQVLQRPEGARMGKPTKQTKAEGGKPENRYSQIIAKVFANHYEKGMAAVPFEREEFVDIAEKLGMELPKNPGDTIYSFKYRTGLPASVTDTAPKGKEWALANVGRAKYEFRLVVPPDLTPKIGLVPVKVPDATPEIVGAYALGDEQALLARVRYNRLVDIFLGVVAWSLQNHLRTTVTGIGQIEVDELYVGVDKTGRQFVVPVEAKGGKDKAGWQQTAQDIACCAQKFPQLVCRAVTAQFVTGNKIAMFELAEKDENIVIIAERHFELVRAADISAKDLALYRQAAGNQE